MEILGTSANMRRGGEDETDADAQAKPTEEQP